MEKIVKRMEKHEKDGHNYFVSVTVGMLSRRSERGGCDWRMMYGMLKVEKDVAQKLGVSYVSPM